VRLLAAYRKNVGTVVQSENEIVQSVLVIVLWLSGMISYKTKQKEENLKKMHKKEITRKHEQKNKGQKGRKTHKKVQN